ncbi:hypothetical protein BC940DRAFT_292137 [Gongronella butleri]|nr:hypothetical protein BC940DRAFT_292137 [Gongronella butleri]
MTTSDVPKVHVKLADLISDGPIEIIVNGKTIVIDPSARRTAQIKPPIPKHVDSQASSTSTTGANDAWVSVLADKHLPVATAASQLNSHAREFVPATKKVKETSMNAKASEFVPYNSSSSSSIIHEDDLDDDDASNSSTGSSSTHHTSTNASFAPSALKKQTSKMDLSVNASEFVPNAYSNTNGNKITMEISPKVPRVASTMLTTGLAPRVPLFVPPQKVSTHNPYDNDNDNDEESDNPPNSSTAATTAFNVSAPAFVPAAKKTITLQAPLIDLGDTPPPSPPTSKAHTPIPKMSVHAPLFKPSAGLKH